MALPIQIWTLRQCTSINPKSQIHRFNGFGGVFVNFLRIVSSARGRRPSSMQILREQARLTLYLVPHSEQRPSSSSKDGIKTWEALQPFSKRTETNFKIQEIDLRGTLLERFYVYRVNNNNNNICHINILYGFICFAYISSFYLFMTHT